MNKRGVTVLTLSIMVAVMAILALAAVPIGNNIHRGAQKSKFQAEINQIEILTSNYIRRNSGNDLEPYAWDISMLSGMKTDTPIPSPPKQMRYCIKYWKA